MGRGRGSRCRPGSRGRLAEFTHHPSTRDPAFLFPRLQHAADEPRRRPRSRVRAQPVLSGVLVCGAGPGEGPSSRAAGRV